ncbi:FecR family protein [Niabella insulamsoli]|uniref:FecR family protein n=1 Tax=Niabella insulamsoli TaxID=3144874 RepID=UPI0031FD945E
MKPGRDLIERFFKNECTAREAEAVARFLEAHPEELERYAPLQEWVSDGGPHLNPDISDRMLEQVRQRYRRDKSFSTTKKILRYLAAAVVLAFVSWLGIALLSGRADEKQIGGVSLSQPAPVAEQVTNTTDGAMQLSLSDCSVITLYPNSRLAYLPAFEKDRRVLHLEGKARFKVAKDAARPFTVYASGIATTALGTEFVVSVSEGKQVSVLLKEGVVKVGPQHPKSDAAPVLLHPGDRILVDSKQFGNYTLKRAAVPARDTKDSQRAAPLKAVEKALPTQAGKLVFKNQSLREVFGAVEKKFGVSVQYDKSSGIDDKLFTGVFLESDDLQFVLNLISRLHDLAYRVEGDTVTIYKK